MSVVSIEERVKYYMDKWYDTKITLKKSDFSSHYETNKVCLVKNGENFPEAPNHRIPYDYEFSKMANDKFYLVAFSDLKLTSNKVRYDTKSKNLDLPIFVKASWSRENGERRRMGVILKLHTRRHWDKGYYAKRTQSGDYIHEFRETNEWQALTDDINWNCKKDECIWRGVTTGVAPKALQAPISQTKRLSKEFKEWRQMPRFHFVSGYHNKYNVGFSRMHGVPRDSVTPCWEKLLKPKVTIKDQLRNKYIISLEGNDVASGLKWQLMSNSMVIMPKPTKISWAMEDTLVPYEHYVPLSDSLDDLEEVLQWCRENDSTCKEIAENATQHMQQFMDHDREEKITKKIISRYDKNVSWE